MPEWSRSESRPTHVESPFAVLQLHPPFPKHSIGIRCFSNRSNNLLLLVNSMIISNVQQFRNLLVSRECKVVDGRCDTDKGHAENAVWPLLRRRHGTGSPIGLVTDRWSRLVPPDTAENMGRDGPRFRLHLSFPRPLN